MFNIIGILLSIRFGILVLFQFTLYMRICQSSWKHVMKFYTPWLIAT